MVDSPNETSSPISSETMSLDVHSYDTQRPQSAIHSLAIKSKSTVLALGASVNPFNASEVRKFSPERLKFRSKFLPISSGNVKGNKEVDCKKWAVLTTIFTPTEAVRRFLYLSTWCVVIVGDFEKPKDYNIPSSLRRRMLFLSHHDQKRMRSKFVDSLPWNSFSRKNIGYLYAISHGAEIIWDFDDDNILKFWLENAAVDQKQWIETFLVANITVSEIDNVEKALFFNPYNYLGSKEQKIWPRGFPLKEILPSRNQMFNFMEKRFPSEKIGILQSLADHQPDVDAIYRLTEQTPYFFDKAYSKRNNTIILPYGLYSPMNAQATLHFKKAFFCLYLPVTVNGRVSDIWRSYIAEALLSLRGLYVGFLPRPLVDQDRNVHSYEGDFQAELPLYSQTSVFVQTLDSWRRNIISLKDHEKRSFEDLMEDLYVKLYEWGFIEIADVTNIQLWLQSIVSVGYDLGQSNRRQNNAPLPNFTTDVGSFILSTPTGMPKSCVQLKETNMVSTFWTSDLHDGTRIDIPSLLSSLGQKFYIAGIKGDHSPYPEVFKLPGIKIYRNLSPEIAKYRSHSTPLSDESISRNAEFYEQDATFKNVDAFYCAFPASMCELWMPFNETKSILFLSAHRYNLGRCNTESWQALNVKLQSLAKMRTDVGLRHVIGADNRYDYEYLYHYTGIKSLELLSSFSGFYTEKSVYRPTRKEILVVYNRGGGVPHVLKNLDFNVTCLFEEYHHYTLDDLTSYPAVIIFPYSVHSFKITEFYSLNIPLFFPSLKYFREHGGLGPDRTSTSYPYCREDKDLWKNMSKHLSSYHSFNPNAEFKDGPEDEMYWLQFSDFYDWSHIQYFDDREDLQRKISKLSKTDLKRIHESMKKENEIRKFVLLSKWCDIIPKLKLRN